MNTATGSSGNCTTEVKIPTILTRERSTRVPASTRMPHRMSVLFGRSSVAAFQPANTTTTATSTTTTKATTTRYDDENNSTNNVLIIFTVILVGCLFILI